MKNTETQASVPGKNTGRKHARIAKIALHLSLAALTTPMMAQADEGVTPATTETAATPATVEAVKADTRNYNIAKQPLYSALSTLAEQAKIQFVYNAEMVKNLTSQGVQGQFTSEEALQKVLSGTGISFRRTGSNTVALELNKSDVTTLKLVKVTGTASNNAFNGPEDNTTYNRRTASSALKTDTPILETPMSIQVVPRAMMNDRQVFNLDDALQNVTGASPNINNTYTNPYLRGFQTDAMFRNGLRQGSQPNVETAQLSNIEVVKGPMSGLYGRSPAGGLIDMITNRPQEEAHYSVQRGCKKFRVNRR